MLEKLSMIMNLKSMAVKYFDWENMMVIVQNMQDWITISEVIIYIEM